MKTYSVKQIAEILKTNPETVRRWIRDKKLTAVQISRKDGNVVTEDELYRFLKASPKYMPRFTANMTASLVTAPAIGVTAMLGTLLGSKFLGYLDDKRDLETVVKSDDIVKFLKEQIREKNKVIQKKQEAIVRLESEIEDDRQKITQMKYLLEHRKILDNIEPTKTHDDKN